MLHRAQVRLRGEHSGRNISRLRAFIDADELVVDVSVSTRDVPPEERFGLQAQIRRGAVSVPCNPVEGAERRTTRDFLHFVSLATGSASEGRYLVSLSNRLHVLDAATASKHNLAAINSSERCRS